MRVCACLCVTLGSSTPQRGPLNATHLANSHPSREDCLQSADVGGHRNLCKINLYKSHGLNVARSYTKDNTSSRQGEQLIPAVISGKRSIRKIIARVLCLKCHQEELERAQGT